VALAMPRSPWDHGDLGIASATGQPVLHDLLAVFPATLELATLALIQNWTGSGWSRPN
jgi:ABC-type antimicrobial peptide transport system permease subunit